MYGIRKHRGLKRYYKNLAIANDFDKLSGINFSKPDTWFDKWHTHFDWKGYGNTSFKRRKPHLDKLFRHFELLTAQSKNLTTDFQLYAIILDLDSSSDALFLHTPNPNNSQFLFEIRDLKSASTLTNKQLDNYIHNLEGYEKLYGQAGEAFCFLFKKNVGLSF